MKAVLPSLVMPMPTGWIASRRRPGILNSILPVMTRLAGSMMETVPPISDDTHNSELSRLNSAKRGRASTSTLATIWRVAVSMKCAMLVVSDVLIRILPSGLIAMPSGSTPTWMSPSAHALFEIDDGHRVVVLVGDIEDLAGGILGEQFRIGTGGQAVHHLLGRGIDHLDLVVVADRDQHELAVPGEFDAARALADLDGLGDGPFVGVDHRYRVALLVRHIGDEGRGGRCGREPRSHSGKQTPTPHPRLSPYLQFSLHLVSGRSTPSVSSSET